MAHLFLPFTPNPCLPARYCKLLTEFPLHVHPFHQQLVTLVPIVEAQLDPPIDRGTTPDPDNPNMARTPSGLHVALTRQRMAYRARYFRLDFLYPRP